MNHQKLDALPEDEARVELTRCCGSSAWVQAMLAARPFGQEEAVFQKAEELWWSLPAEAWLEAFEHHPKIGDISTLRAKFQNTGDWAKNEQSGVQQASEEVLQGLAQGNMDYEEKFGYIFIVCATGKSAAEMLDLLQARLPNDPATELKLAAGEQMKITRLRLEKL